MTPIVFTATAIALRSVVVNSTSRNFVTISSSEYLSREIHALHFVRRFDDGPEPLE